MGMLYTILRGAVRSLSPKMKTIWAQPFAGEPCVFVPNHAGAFGPIDICAKFPLADQCHVWLNAAMMEPREVPAYVRQDYWWKPGCRMEWLYNATLPYLAAVLIPPILRSVPETCPVYHDNRVLTTMRLSLKYLQKGEHLVIFPEQPSGYQSHHMWINTGFLNVAPLFYRATGKALLFYPVHIDCKRHVFRIAPPVRFDPERTLEAQQDELVEKLAKGLRGEG